jgi:hypothetical protein
MDFGPGSIQFSFTPDLARVDVDVDPDRGPRHALQAIGGLFGVKSDPLRVFDILAGNGIDPGYSCDTSEDEP